MKKILFIGAMCLICSIAVFSQSKRTWEQTQSLNSISAYQDFISKYPDGKYTVIAKQKLEELQEQEDWKNAENKEGTINAYRNFITKYPNSVHISNAKEKLQILEKELSFNLEVENDLKTAITANDTTFKKITKEKYLQLFSHQKETLHSWIINLVISNGYMIAPGCTATLFIDQNEKPVLIQVSYAKADYINGKMIPKGDINAPIRIIHESPFIKYDCLSYDNEKTNWERIIRKVPNSDKITSNTVVKKEGFYYMK
jgi:hypothetical protein